MSKKTRYLFVTGGVVSSLGKGIVASSLGTLLKARGLKVTIQKLDPYINVDAGTMNPYQHGEVFVTVDGAETDLDLGHYERYIDENLKAKNNLTTGKIYGRVIERERRGDYLGDTVRFIPHITDQINNSDPIALTGADAQLIIQHRTSPHPRFDTIPPAYAHDMRSLATADVFGILRPHAW